MHSSTDDAILFAQGEQRRNAAPNWYLLLFAVILTLFAVYWGFVRPTTRQLTKLRRYVTSLESSVADLNVQRLSNGETVSMLEKMVEQENETKEATAALREMRALHRQMVQEAEQLTNARTALESLAALRAQVARQATLIASTNDALVSLQQLRTQIADSASETHEAKLAVDEVNTLRDGLIESINTLKDVQPVISRVQEVQQRIAGVADGASMTEAAVEKVETLHRRIQTTVAARTDEVATAIETLELATDVKLEMKRAGETFGAVKRMLSEFNLMQPALMQAVDSLQPLTELADLRRLGVHELRRVATSLGYRDAAVAHSVPNEMTDYVEATYASEAVEAPMDPLDVVLAEPVDETELSTEVVIEEADVEADTVEVAAESPFVAEEVEGETAEVELAEIPELTDFSESDYAQTIEASIAIANSNLRENEVVEAVVNAVSEVAQQVSGAVEVVADAKDTTVK